MELEKYIDNLIDAGLDKNHWFITKQTMSDYYFPFYVGHVVETYPTKHLSNQNFQMYYTQCFKNNPETKSLYPKQCESENTYRNAIIAEFLGLIERTDSQYAHATATKAYFRLKKYISKASDIQDNRAIVDRQIEKICLNVIQSKKYDDVKDVTLFPVIFLYKILLELYNKYKDSKLTYNEFSLFVMRTKKYEDYDQVMDLIGQYRKHNYSAGYDAKINSILTHQSTENVRFDTLFGSLTHIEYVKNESYRIKNDQESYDYIKTTISIYEKSLYAKTTSKKTLKEFMQSELYFEGELDSPQDSGILTQEQFRQMVENEEKVLDGIKGTLDELASKYGEEGTTTVSSVVRLSSVQKAFRDILIAKNSQKCLMCDIKNRDMLIASHIKEASSSNIYEKADFDNGLLLCANHDKLFDKFLITFNFYDGKIQISKSLTDEEKKICLLDEEYVLPKELMTQKRKEYLMWHNEQFHKKEAEC